MLDSSNVIFLSLGSNIGNRQMRIEKAIALLSQYAGRILATSSFQETKPEGFQSSNNFLNAAVMLQSDLNPMQLLEATEKIERTLGRIHKTQKGNEYEDRTIDIDILLYSNQTLKNDTLELPHPRMTQRAFVMQPLAEIAPNYIHPIENKSFSEIASTLTNMEQNPPQDNSDKSNIKTNIVEQVMLQGVVFKRSKQTVETNEKKNVRLSNYLKGTHRSGAAKKKAEFKYKRALRNAQSVKAKS